MDLLGVLPTFYDTNMFLQYQELKTVFYCLKILNFDVLEMDRF